MAARPYCYSTYAKTVHKNYHIHDSWILILAENCYMIAVSLSTGDTLLVYI